MNQNLNKESFNESVLDLPQASLAEEVWHISDETGSFQLTEDARSKIQNVVDWVQSNWHIPNLSVHITGSIASNSYSDSSDVDVHFCSSNVKEGKADEFNRVLRAQFDEFKLQNEEQTIIGKYPIEIYFQENPSQDMMSVGCYDFLQNVWLVGPEIKDQDYDPYEDLYDDDMKQLDNIIGDVRENLFKVYELATVWSKTGSQTLKNELQDDFTRELQNSEKLFDSIRQVRKLQSSPKNDEEALKSRNSRIWKIADSAFKLLDKFGYIGLMRSYADFSKKIASRETTCEEAIQKIPEEIKDKIGKKLLSDSEFLSCIDECDCLEAIDCSDSLSEGEIDENAKSLLSLAAICSLLAIPSFMTSTALGAELKSVPKKEMRLNSSSVKEALKKASNAKMIGKMNETNVVNAVARTVYAEARGEYASQGKKALQAVGSVIWNRAGGDPENFAKVISAKAQWSSWKSYSGGWTDETFIYKIPAEVISSKKARAIWDECNAIALEMVQKKFKSTIGNRNMIANKKLDNKAAYDSWGKNCDLTIGSHSFGYDKSQDGFKKAKKATSARYVVAKSGDTLWKIAKDNHTTVKSILDKNPNITKPDKISVGQKIMI